MSVNVLILLVFAALMLAAAWGDLLTMTIPNRLTLAVIVGFAVVAPLVGLPLVDIGWHLGAALVVLLITFGLFAAGWIGGGDAKFAAATVLWLGPEAALNYGLHASLFGGLLALLLLQFRALPLPRFGQSLPWLVHLHQPTTGVPYGIALAAGGMTAFFESPMWRIATGN